MITFNVFGCCVSRDALELLERRKTVCVLQMVGGSTTISAFSPRFERTYTIDDFKDYKGTNYFKRILCQDLNKTAISYLFEKRSDFLLIDPLPNCLDMFKRGEHFLSLSEVYYKNRERFAKDFHLDEYELVKMADQTIDNYADSLDQLCSIALKFYSPSQIIINEIYGAQSYIDKNRKKAFDSFIGNPIDKYNKIVGEMYSYIESKLKGCHIIKFPDNVIADPANKWGLYHLHYHEHYYEYCSKAIEFICSDPTLEYAKEVETLEELRQTYSEKFELLNLKLELTAKNDSLKWASNAATFEKKLLLDFFQNRRFIDNLLQIKEKSSKVAVLKCTDNAGEILIKALESYGIEVAFKTHLWDLKWLKADEFERCKQADLVISANIHAVQTHSVSDDVKVISILDLLK